MTDQEPLPGEPREFSQSYVESRLWGCYDVGDYETARRICAGYPYEPQAHQLAAILEGLLENTEAAIDHLRTAEALYHETLTRTDDHDEIIGGLLLDRGRPTDAGKFVDSAEKHYRAHVVPLAEDGINFDDYSYRYGIILRLDEGSFTEPASRP